MSLELATIDAPNELKSTVAACVKWSGENIIATQEQHATTWEHRKELDRAIKSAEEFFKPLAQQADQLHKQIVQRWNLLRDPLKEAKAIDDKKMLVWKNEQDAKAERERQRLQAIADDAARKEREKAEAEAAKQRRIEFEQRARAEAARIEAEAASAADKKRLLAEAEAAERKANAAKAKEERAEEKSAAVVAPVIAVASSAPKIAGQSVRRSWKATVVDQAAFLEYVFANRRADLVLVNQAVLDALAKGLKSAAEMPGIRFEETSSLAASGR